MSDTDLTPQEKRLIARAASGAQWEPEGYGKAVNVDFDSPSNAENLPQNRTIRAAVIRALAVGETWPGETGPWPVHAHGIRILGARVTGNLERATLDHFLCFAKCIFDGFVEFSGSHCKTIEFSGSHVLGFSANGAKFDGNVFLRYGFTATGYVDFVGATIHGYLDCDNGHFENCSGQNKGKALNANGVIVDCGVFLRKGFVAKGEVNFGSAKIETNFECDNGLFINPNDIALNANGMVAGGGVFLREGFTAEGEMNFNSAVIKSQFQCCGGTFANPDGDALNLRFAEIGSALRFEPRERAGRKWPAAKFDGTLDLRQAKCRTFSDHPDAWPAPGKLLLDGFTYERFDSCPTQWRKRQQWLELQKPQHLGRLPDGGKDDPDEPAIFRPQPWVQASKVLMEMGHEADARDLAVARETLRTQSADIGWWQRRWRRMLEHTIGYGYKPFRVLFCSLVFCLFGGGIFATATMAFWRNGPPIRRPLT